MGVVIVVVGRVFPNGSSDGTEGVRRGGGGKGAAAGSLARGNRGSRGQEVARGNVLRHGVVANGGGALGIVVHGHHTGQGVGCVCFACAVGVYRLKMSTWYASCSGDSPPPVGVV